MRLLPSHNSIHRIFSKANNKDELHAELVFIYHIHFNYCLDGFERKLCFFRFYVLTRNHIQIKPHYIDTVSKVVIENVF